MSENPTTAQAEAAPRTLQLVSVNAGTSDPSSTQMLADRIADRTVTAGAEHGLDIVLRQIDLRGLATDITNAIISQHVSPELQRALDLMRDADLLPAVRDAAQALLERWPTHVSPLLDRWLRHGQQYGQV